MKSKLSKKQQEVVDKLKSQNTYITEMHGIHCSCFIHNNVNYKISLSTLNKLKKLGVVASIKSDWRATDWGLLEERIWKI